MDSWMLLAIILALSLLFITSRRRSQTPITISKIVVYPVKSCGGISLPESRVTETGLFLDRTWILIDRQGAMVTARQDPRLWNIQPEIDLLSPEPPSTLSLVYEGNRFSLDLTQPLGEKLTIAVFKETAEVADQGPAAADWLQRTLGKDYRLFKIVTPRLHSDLIGTEEKGTPVNLPDLMQILLASEASLQAVVSASPLPKRAQLTMGVFRPNLTVHGPPAFAEDTWREITISEQKFLGAAPCPRCLMTTIDPESLEFDGKTEPLPTLRRIHGKELKGYFGQWFVRTTNGRVRVGDRIQVAKTKTFPN